MKGSALAYYPLLAVPIALLSGLFGSAVASENLLYWQALFVTGMMVPIVGLAAGIAETREIKARSGGMETRSTSLKMLRLCRFIVCTVVVVCLILVNFGITYAMTGASDAALAALLAAIATPGLVGILQWVARGTGTVFAVLFGFVWQIGGVTLAENSNWFLYPPAWQVRILLPTIGIHSNAVPLVAGEPLLTESPWLAILLNLVLGIFGAWLAIQFPLRLRRKAPRVEQQHLQSPELTRALSDRQPQSVLVLLWVLTRLLFTTATGWCVALSLGMIALIALIYPPNYLVAFYSLGLLPVGAGVLAVLVWSVLRPTWSLSVVETPVLRSAVLLWQSAVVAILSLVTASLVDHSWQRFILWTLTGILMMLSAQTLQLYWGVTVSLGAVVVWTIFSLTLGGDVLADTLLWFPALPSWGMTAVVGTRFPIAVVTCVLLIGIGLLVSRRAIRHVERTW
ncbi:hypothetical protein WG915_07825 [Corynebacterium sp. H128]|uniref:hypothetical protein n=1 Tax=Corynebacterium sp. H128 TaxID=3133427 RepID=UPI0030A200E1